MQAAWKKWFEHSLSSHACSAGTLGLKASKQMGHVSSTARFIICLAPSITLRIDSCSADKPYEYRSEVSVLKEFVSTMIPTLFALTCL
jgi:hypothetical protein